MAVLLAHLRVPLSWREILTRTIRDAIADNVFGMAAQLAYYFFFALFPALLLLITIASYFPVHAESYGGIGGVMVLMLWFYISGAVILFGAEMNAEIEHASPYGKEPGEKVPGQRRLIGAAAMRAWIAKRRRRGGKPPSADEVKKVAEQQPAAAAVTAAKTPGSASSG